MKKIAIKEEIIAAFQVKLAEEEKSEATKEKYIRDVRAFMEFYRGNELKTGQTNELTKETVIAYKQHLIKRGFAVRSINSMLASLNSLFGFLGRPNLKVKSLKVQQQVFRPEEKELTKEEYGRL